MKLKQAVCSLVLFFAFFQDLARSADWLMGGKHINNDRYADDEFIINRDNVNQLDARIIVPAPVGFEITPTMIDDWIYTVSPGGDVVASDRNTGELRWLQLFSDFGVRGVEGEFSRTSPLILDDMIVIGSNFFPDLYAFNRFTGELLWFSILTDLACAKVVVSPIFAGDFVYIGLSSGSQGPLVCPFGRGMMVAVKPSDGSVVWIFDTVQQNSTNPFDASAGASVWGRNPAFDEGRNVVYVPTGQPYTLPQTAYDCEKRRRPGDPLCIPDGVYSNSIIALDMSTGERLWDTKLFPYDGYFLGCPTFITPDVPPGCPDPAGSDYDVGQGPILFTIEANGTQIDAVGAGTKAGEYWALNRDTGEIIWNAKVGFGGPLGGLEFGSAADEERIYVASCNSNRMEYRLETNPDVVIRGAHWAALDKNTGEILWETPTPVQDVHNFEIDIRNNGPVTVANGIVYGGVMDPEGHMVAMDAETGEILWQYKCGASVGGGPAVVDGNVFWGCGYIGDQNGAFYVFSLPGDETV